MQTCITGLFDWDGWGMKLFPNTVTREPLLSTQHFLEALPQGEHSGKRASYDTWRHLAVWRLPLSSRHGRCVELAIVRDY